MVTSKEVQAAITALSAMNEDGSITPAVLANVLNLMHAFADLGQVGSLIEQFKVVSSLSDLPSSPTDKEKVTAFLVGTKAYVYVGTGGNVVSGTYMQVDLGTNDAEAIPYDSTLTTHTAGSVGEGMANITIGNAEAIAIAKACKSYIEAMKDSIDSASTDEQKIASNTASINQILTKLNGGSSMPSLEIGTLSASAGTEQESTTRARTEDFITAPFSIETNSEYILRSLYTYDEDEVFQSVYNPKSAAYSITEDTGYKYRLVFCKTTDTEEITSLTDIIKSYEDGNESKGLSDRMDDVEDEVGQFDSRITSNKNEITEIDKVVNGYEPSAPNLELGTFSASTGAESDSKTRARTTEFIEAPFSIETNDGYLLRTVFPYNSDGTLVSGSVVSPKKTSYSISENTGLKYKLVFNKSTDTEEITSLTDIIKSYEDGTAMSGLVDKIGGKILYVSPDGSDENDGSSSKKLATFQKAIDLGAETIIADAGDYTGQTLISSVSNKSLSIICMGTSVEDKLKRKKPATINNGIQLSFTDDATSGLKVCSKQFSTSSNWYKVFVSKGLDPIRPKGTYDSYMESNTRADSPNAILWEVTDGNSDRKLTPVLSLSECQSTDGTMYYDHTNGKIYINTSISSAEYWAMNNEEGFLVNLQGYANIRLENISFKFSPCFVNIEDCSHVEMLACIVSHCAYGTGIRPNNSNIRFSRCEAYKVCGDGFSASFGGHCEYYDCIAHHCDDDGISCHTGCTGFVSGGEFYNCVKGALSPAEGSMMDIQGAFCHDSTYGIQAAQSNTEEHKYTLGATVRHSNCVMYNNSAKDYYIENYNVIAFNCKYGSKSVVSNDYTSLTEL